MALRPGEPFDRYLIEAGLGEGGMGQVYRALDTRLRRHVALKVISVKEGGALSSEGAARLLREARAAAAIDHPNAVSIFDVGEVDGVPYLAMEFIEGRTLRASIGDASVPMPKRVEWLVAVGRALAAAHKRGLVHRDVKPENVMVRVDGVIKVVDFGIARAAHVPMATATTTPAGNAPVTPLTTLTGQGVTIGTPLYMSPEQLRNDPIDGRSDQFSWGVMAYELAAGRCPWPAELPAVHVISHILSKTPTPLRELAPDVPPALESAIARALEKEPASRFETMDALVATLDVLGAPASAAASPSGAGAATSSAARAKSHAPGVASGASASRSRWLADRRWAVALLVAVVGAGALGTVYAMKRGGTSASDARELAGKRPAVALLSFRSLSHESDASWLATALPEMIGTELAGGDQFQVIPSDTMVRAARDLGLAANDSLSPDTVAKLRKLSGADYLVAGTYVVVSDKKLRADVSVLDARTGAIATKFAINGSSAELFDLVTRTGAEVRRRLGKSALSAEETASLRAAVPRGAEAARDYADGLQKERTFDYFGAKAALERAVYAEPDFPLSHLALSRVWFHLGFDKNAEEEARRALDHSAHLSREKRLNIEAQLAETGRNFALASEHYRTLFGFFPESIEYGLRYARAQVLAGKRTDAFDTIERLRKLPATDTEDPRIDLMEAFVAAKVADFPRRLAAASAAARKGQAMGAWGVVAAARSDTGEAHADMGDLDAADADLEQARAIYEKRGDHNGLGSVLALIAHDARARGNYERADKLDAESLVFAKEIGDQYRIGGLLNSMAISNALRGRLAEAKAGFDEARAVYEQIQDAEGVGHAFGNVGWCLMEEGKLDLSIDPIERALAIHRELNMRMGVLNETEYLACLAHLRGDLASAKKQYDAALVLAEALSSKQTMAELHARQAELAMDEGNVAAAKRGFESVRDDFGKLDDAASAARAEIGLAKVALHANDVADAEKEARAALTRLGASPNPDDEAAARAILARALVRAGKLAEATDAGERAGALGEKSERASVRIETSLALAEVRVASGAAPSSIAAIEDARARAKASALARLVLEADLVLASAERASRHPARAASLLAGVQASATSKGYVLLARAAAAQRR